MVVQSELTDDETDRLFHALAAATRRDILRRTIAAEHSVSALAADYDMSFAAVQKHVGVLEAAGLIIKRAEGRERLVRADPRMIARARALLARYEDLWRARIDRLDALLAEQPAAPTPLASAAPSPPSAASPPAAGDPPDPPLTPAAGEPPRSPAAGDPPRSPATGDPPRSPATAVPPQPPAVE